MATESAASTARQAYRRIDASAVHDTIAQLERRITVSFPESGLRRVAQALIEVAREANHRIERIRRPSVAIRVTSWLLAAAVVLILLSVPFTLRLGDVGTVADAVQVLEAALSASFFIGAGILFLVTLEGRLRRGRSLSAIDELRALAHVVDMHQLTKDPAMLLGLQSIGVESKRTYTPFDLQRYLDYCTEMLALISKIAVLYVQDISDPVARGVVDEVEDLTNGLSRKIWQKIMLIQRDLGPGAARAAAILDETVDYADTLAPTVTTTQGNQESSSHG